MASTTRVCRLCRAVVPPKRTVHLFNANAVKNKWASRISDLLGVPLADTDRISPYMCDMCKTRLVSLEKAVTDLGSFRELVKHSREALSAIGPLKRTRVTGSDVGVSPDTAKERPSSKLARKRLTFTCKYENNTSNGSIIEPLILAPVRSQPLRAHNTSSPPPLPPVQDVDSNSSPLPPVQDADSNSSSSDLACEIWFTRQDNNYNACFLHK